MRELLGEEDGETAAGGSSARSAFGDGNGVGSADAKGSFYRFTCIWRLCAISEGSPHAWLGYPNGRRLPCPGTEFDTKSAFDAIKEQGVTSFITIPAIMAGLLSYDRCEEKVALGTLEVKLISTETSYEAYATKIKIQSQPCGHRLTMMGHVNYSI